MTNTINFFDEVIIEKEKPLILCDIDDTLLKYTYRFEHFFNETKMIYSTALYDELFCRAENDYYLYRILNDPEHTDMNGFNNLCKRIKEKNGDIMFITARSYGAVNTTERHFKILNLKYDDFTIHYTSSKITKGEYITKNIDISGREEIIFIDDQEQNLQSVKKLLPQIKCYKFVYK